jgi:hypothetical protein
LPDGLTGAFATETRLRRMLAVIAPLANLVDTEDSELRMPPIEMK